jgi:CelD/BcsL family acetyltransferase involved in cellulose biosynthesis
VNLNLSIVRDEAAFYALREDWQRLHAASATCSPFQHWEWVQLWWQECRAEYELALGIVREGVDGPVCGIAPLVIGPDREGLRRNMRHLGFIHGLGPVQGERLDFLVAAGDEARVMPMLSQIIQRTRGQWDAVRLNKVPQESANYSYLLGALRHVGCGVDEMNTTICHSLRLPETWDGLLATRSGDWRSKTKRSWKKLQEGRQLQIIHTSSAGEGQDVPGLIDTFFRLHSLHWPDGKSSFTAERMQRVHRQLLAQWLPEKTANLSFIQLDDQFVAGVYTLHQGQEAYLYQQGWDPTFSQLSLGQLIIQTNLQHCLENHGARLYDMLPGDYDYKRRLCNHARYTVDLECFNPESLRAHTFRLLRKIKRLSTAEPDQKPPAAAPHIPTSFQNP